MSDPSTGQLSQFEVIQKDASDHLDALQTSLNDRQGFEDDLIKLELWTSEVEATLSKPPDLDCTVDRLQQQVKKYQVRSNTIFFRPTFIYRSRYLLSRL